MDLTSGRAWTGPRNDLNNAWTFDRPGPSLWCSLSFPQGMISMR
ncbi:hypothetical protein CGCVW01_v001363 [Colletotrichum viniferum]|nr:hypothetical protein CGCVW01_v001363 [Colletotrichum viniferum]